MRDRQGLFVLLGVLLMACFLGKTAAAEMEYTDPAKQARWEAAHQKRAWKAERRRDRFSRWVDGNLKKLKPNPNAHRGNDMAGTVSNVDIGGETK